MPKILFIIAMLACRQQNFKSKIIVRASLWLTPDFDLILPSVFSQIADRWVFF